jgi:hypothetical protein
MTSKNPTREDKSGIVTGKKEDTLLASSRGCRALQKTRMSRDCAGVASAQRERDAKEPNSW